jgi:hypothetical protein
VVKADCERLSQRKSRDRHLEIIGYLGERPVTMWGRTSRIEVESRDCSANFWHSNLALHLQQSGVLMPICIGLVRNVRLGHGNVRKR